MFTTLQAIRDKSPCESGWKKLLLSLNITKITDSDLKREVTILEILESNGVQDAFWCLRTQEYSDIYLILADIAESVLPYYEKKYPDDSRVKKCIQGIRDFKNDIIDLAELKSLHDAAYAATDAAAYAAYAAYAAAADAAYTAAYAAADAAATAVYAYAVDVYAYAVDVAYAAAARKKQWKKNEEILRKHLLK